MMRFHQTATPLIKFGDSNVVFTGGGTESNDKTYNAGNWALIIGGTALTAGGLVLYNTDNRAPGIYGYAPSGLGVSWALAKF